MATKFVKFTEEEMAQAGSVNLIHYLEQNGERLKREGGAYRIVDNEALKSTIVKSDGSTWFNHYIKEGGNAIHFLTKMKGYHFTEAVTELLGGEYKLECNNAEAENSKKTQEKKPFSPPEKAANNKRIINYLTQKRLIDKNVVSFFIAQNKIYQDKQYGNIVFCGYDESDKMRFAYKRGIYDGEKTFKGSVAGSDGTYSFNHTGTNKTLFVFEGAIDMLSYITLNPNNWRDNSYVALDGLSEQPMLKLMDKINPEKVVLCLDRDESGIEATQKFEDILEEKGVETACQLSKYKDWNEQLKAQNGINAELGVESYQLTRHKELLLKLFYMENSGSPPEDLEQVVNTELAILCEKYLKVFKSNNAQICEHIPAEELQEVYTNLMELTRYYVESAMAEAENGLKPLFAELKNEYRAYLDKGNLNRKVADLNENFKNSGDTKSIVKNLISVTIALTKGFQLEQLQAISVEQEPQEQMQMA